MSNAEWLDRPEPFRVPLEEFTFKPEVSNKELRQMRASFAAGACLAQKLSDASGFNSKSDVMSGAIGYVGSRELEDGTTEELIGCSRCGAMCTIQCTPHKKIGPGTAEDPNMILGIAEAPQSNPWLELGTFDDCKAGRVTVPEEASNLTKPVGLDSTQRAMVKILSGHYD